MVNKKNIYFVGLLLSIICIYLILAAPNAPTNLVFNNNATPNYDEGVFTLNWTSGAGDAESNYSIYVFSNSSIYLVASNNSVTGYSFSNTTEANYTFIVEAINETGFGTNSSNISIYVDTTAPVITLPEYVNGTKKKNTESLILNISVTDATSGLTNGVCLIDVNGTNQSVSISDGWCNSSSIALTGLSDGNQTINVWVNDSTNNIGLNNSYVVEIDTTAPVITLPEYTNGTKKKNTESLILNISVTDATSGLTNGVCLIDVNGTNQSVSISDGWCNSSSIALTGLSDGNQTINVWVNDSTNNIGLNNSYVVQIDTTAPVITLPFYTNATKKKNTESLILNISVTDATSGLTNGVCLIDVNGTNQSVSISDGWCNSSSIALTGLSDGNQTINVWVNDSTNNIGLNNSYVVQIDTTAPVITLPFYTNATKKKNTESLILNISVTDATSGLTNGVCLIDVNGTNQSVSISDGWCNSSSIALTGLSDGNQTINVWVNDSTNNIGLNNSYVVQIDTTAPVITLPFYTNATKKKNTESLILNISVTDATSGLTNGVCLIDVNGTNQSVSISDGWCNSSSIALTGLSDGNQTINVWVNDSTNNIGLNNSYVVQIDTTAPVITLPFYTNATKKKNTESLILNISVTDATSGLTNGVCLIDVNGTNQSVSISSGWCNASNIALTGLTDGNKTIKVWVNDSTNNIGLNDSYVVQIDTTAPVITLPFYTNVTKKKNTESLILNISVTDATSGLTNGVCLIDVNGTNQSVSISSGWCNASNIALTGLTDGNKTIKVWVNDSTNNIGLNDSYVVQIDTTAPVITLPFYTNGTKKKNTESLILNISVTDATSGLTNGVCLIDVNGTNQSVSISSGWCNASNIALTGLTDGNKTIKVWVNDSTSNIGLNNSYVVQVDSTNPVITLTLSSAVTDSLVLSYTTTEGSCVADRGTISTADSTITEYLLDCGTSYAYTLTCTDLTGNSATLTESFSTNGCSGGAGGSSSSSSSSASPSYWSNTFTNEDVNFIGGVTKDLAVKNRMRVELSGTDHYVGIMELTSTTAKISINSDPQEVVFSIGESKRFDVNNDGFYDLLITLNSIINNKASITALLIYEKIVTEVVEEPVVAPSTPTPEVTAEEEIAQEEVVGTTMTGKIIANLGENSLMYGILIGLIVLALIGYYFRIKNKNKKLKR